MSSDVLGHNLTKIKRDVYPLFRQYCIRHGRFFDTTISVNRDNKDVKMPSKQKRKRLPESLYKLVLVLTM